MGNRLGYVVVTYNQASHQPGLDYSDLHPDMADAVAERDLKRAMTAEHGRGERHLIAEVFELDD